MQAVAFLPVLDPQGLDKVPVGNQQDPAFAAGLFSQDLDGPAHSGFQFFRAFGQMEGVSLFSDFPELVDADGIDNLLYVSGCWNTRGFRNTEPDIIDAAAFKRTVKNFSEFRQLFDLANVILFFFSMNISSTYGDFKAIFLILFVLFFKNTNDFDMLSMKIFLPYPEIALKKPQ